MPNGWEYQHAEDKGWALSVVEMSKERDKHLLCFLVPLKAEALQITGFPLVVQIFLEGEIPVGEPSGRISVLTIAPGGQEVAPVPAEKMQKVLYDLGVL